MKMANTTVLVTGANRGIGQALVEEALSRGATRVYAGTRRPLAHPDGRVTPLTLDLTNAAQLRGAVENIESLDLLFNNAGVARKDDLSDRAVLEWHLAVNLFGTYGVTRAFLPLLARSRGAIVNVLSTAALAAFPLLPTYSISEAAAFSLTQSLRALLAARGAGACRPGWRRGHGYDPRLRQTEGRSGVRRASHRRRRGERGGGDLSRSSVSVSGGELAQRFGQGPRAPICGARGTSVRRGMSHLCGLRKENTMLLHDKAAVIYGAGGAIGGAVARAFAREGARLFLTGRQRAPVEVVAKDVVSAGGSADVAEVDALDEQAVDEHLQSVIDEAARVDISFNAVGVPDAEIVGVPLVELEAERFSLAIAAYTRSYFVTARMAARRMVANRSGVIMTVTAIHSRTGIPLVGGYGPAQAAKEALTRGLSAELAPQGIRVVGLRPYAMPETRTIKEGFERRAKASGMTWEQYQGLLAGRTHPRRLMTLAEMANMAVFMASDQASGMTGTTVNLTMGSLDD